MQSLLKGPSLLKHLSRHSLHYSNILHPSPIIHTHTLSHITYRNYGLFDRIFKREKNEEITKDKEDKNIYNKEKMQEDG